MINYRLRIILFLSIPFVARSHSITANNLCGYGQPVLVGDGFPTMNLNSPYSVTGDFRAWRVFLQTGSCAVNGDGCSVVEGTIDGGGAWMDNSLIPPLAFSVPFEFSFQSGVAGRQCLSASCSCNHDTYCVSSDDAAVVNDPGTNSGVIVTFCPSGGSVQQPPSSLPGNSVNPPVNTLPPENTVPSAVVPTPTVRHQHTWAGQEGSWNNGWHNFKVVNTSSSIGGNENSDGGASDTAKSQFRKCGLLGKQRRKGT